MTPQELKAILIGLINIPYGTFLHLLADHINDDWVTDKYRQLQTEPGQFILRTDDETLQSFLDYIEQKLNKEGK